LKPDFLIILKSRRSQISAKNPNAPAMTGIEKCHIAFVACLGLV
jgi:hypothetical protein